MTFVLKNGDAAPPIELRDQNGELWRLSNSRSKMVLLHFGRGEY
ncbi:MAG TPA: hypothetical protein VFJ58_05885 [Armatimonadota bacterium]|nr:hypothetical protein [Armatimonadota bacterium]